MVRCATTADAPAIHRLITADADGHLLRPDAERSDRTCESVPGGDRARPDRRLCELAPLGSSVAEVRSFVVRTHLRRPGSGPAVDRRTARPGPNPRVRTTVRLHPCPRPTSSPSRFRERAAHLGAREIAADCRRCSLFGTCGQSDDWCSAHNLAASAAAVRASVSGPERHMKLFRAG